MRLQGIGHAGIDLGQPVGEVLNAAVLGDVACQLVRRLRGWTAEPFGVLPDKPAKPDIAEVHQFAVLHVAKVRRVREHGIEAVRREFGLGRALAAYGDAAVGAVRAFPNPLAVDHHAKLARAGVANLVGRRAIALSLDILGDNVRPAAGADIGPRAVNDAEEVGFTLHQADREAVNGEDVE